MVPSADPAGVELDESLTAKLAETGDGEENLTDDQPTGPFRFVHEAAADTLVRYLRREHPQTIAIVAANVSPKQASDIITRLPAELQSAVLSRIATLDVTDPAIIREVEDGLKTLLSDQIKADGRRAAGLAAVRAILEVTDQRERQDVLGNLSQSDMPLVHQLVNPQRPVAGADTGGGGASTAASAGAPDDPVASSAAGFLPLQLEFEDLISIEDASLAVLFQHASPHVCLLALAGAPDTLVARIMKQLPRRSAKRLRQQIERIGPLQLQDVELAQLELAKVASELASQGKIAVPSTRRFSVAV